MAFDWLQFLSRYNVEYISRGRPARGDWIAVTCPWCGPHDPHHLGINVKTGVYNCWHGLTHKGLSPVRLVAALLSCSYDEAGAIVTSGSTSFARSDATFADDAMARLGVKTATPRLVPEEIEFLPEFTPVRETGLCWTLVYPYLDRRGYDADDVQWLTDRYELKFASRGKFSYRVILPVRADGRLVNWTGRTVAQSDDLRYKSLSSDPDKAAEQGLPVAALNIKDTLFDLDKARQGGRVLVLVEGPFDAMRVGYLGERRGVRSTCAFGKTLSRIQIDLLAELVPRYDNVYSMFDQGAGFDAFMSLPSYLGIGHLNLPPGADDPAELTPRQFAQLDL